MSLVGARLYTGSSAAAGTGFWWGEAVDTAHFAPAADGVRYGPSGAAGLSTRIATGSTQYLFPFSPASDCTLDSLTANITVGSAGVTRLAIYEATNLTNFYPTSLIVQTNELSTAAATQITQAGLATKLRGGGRYYVGWWGSGGPTVSARASLTLFDSGFNTIPGIQRGATYTPGVSVWPATFPSGATLSNATVICVLLKLDV